MASPTFLCTVQHKLPDNDLLRFASQREISTYQFCVVNRNGRPSTPKKGFIIPEQSSVLVICQRPRLTIFDMGVNVSNNQMSYRLCYKRALPPAQAPWDKLTVVSSFYGFRIYTSVALDWSDATQSLRERDYYRYLFFTDRAINTLLNSVDISDNAERSYDKGIKLRNLFLDQPESHEGALALQRSCQQFTKCYEALKSSALVA